MRLIHYSPRNIEKLKPREYDQNEIKFHCKPNGFWVSVEGPDDWKEWCKSEEFRLDRLRYSNEVILKKEANILYLNTTEDILSFSKDYAYTSRTIKNVEFYGDEDTHELNWFEIKKKYQGIIIAPYQWDCRLDLRCSWYYSWDCASGCIWDLNCIETLLFIEEDLTVPDKPKKRISVSDTVKNSLIDSVFFLTEDGHKKHEYEFCERTVMNSIQYLNSKRTDKNSE